MERLKARIEAYKREQLKASSMGATRKYQQEHFIHHLYSSEKSDMYHQGTGQQFLQAWGFALTLLLENDCVTPDEELIYKVPFYDANLPFFMYFLDDRFADPEREIPEKDTALLGIHMRELSGLVSNSRSVHLRIEKNYSRGFIVMNEETTRVHLPYAGYRSDREERILQDAQGLVRILEKLEGVKPDEIRDVSM